MGSSLGPKKEIFFPEPLYIKIKNCQAGVFAGCKDNSSSSSNNNKTHKSPTPHTDNNCFVYVVGRSWSPWKGKPFIWSLGSSSGKGPFTDAFGVCRSLLVISCQLLLLVPSQEDEKEKREEKKKKVCLCDGMVPSGSLPGSLPGRCHHPRCAHKDAEAREAQGPAPEHHRGARDWNGNLPEPTAPP